MVAAEDLHESDVHTFGKVGVLLKRLSNIFYGSLIQVSNNNYRMWVAHGDCTELDSGYCASQR